MAYRPTSIGFINLPNPIEPGSHAVPPQRHPLNPSAPNQDLFKVLLDSSSERPAKRQKAIAENPVIDLPRLPVRHPVKRHRLPPTLSGLHQPPPDAGLLPSISVEKPQSPRQQPEEPSKKPRRTRRNKWTDEETQHLLKGVAVFGFGNWTKILACQDYHFTNRTALDLKDRFRIVRPNHRRQLEASDAPLDEDRPSLASTRRPRTVYTAEEDAALLRAFRQHGAKWSLIKKSSPELFSTRTPTDLRDRFRTRFAPELARARLAPHPVASAPHASEQHPPASTDDVEDDVTSAPTIPSKRPPAPRLFSLDDVFLSSTSDAQHLAPDDEPIVLDRGILDWAVSDAQKPAVASRSSHTPLVGGTSSAAIGNAPSGPTAPTRTVQPSRPSLLPSLLPGSVVADPLELPSLLQMLGETAEAGSEDFWA